MFFFCALFLFNPKNNCFYFFECRKWITLFPLWSVDRLYKLILLFLFFSFATNNKPAPKIPVFFFLFVYSFKFIQKRKIHTKNANHSSNGFIFLFFFLFAIKNTFPILGTHANRPKNTLKKRAKERGKRIRRSLSTIKCCKN